jgi:hypothetical protein
MSSFNARKDNGNSEAMRKTKSLDAKNKKTNGLKFRFPHFNIREMTAIAFKKMND